jgi:squalene synthase HpnC
VLAAIPAGDRAGGGHVTSEGELDAADSYCRYLAGRHYENFSVASRIMPAEARRHLARIYAFCRATDDLGDESSSYATQRLQIWRDDLARCFEAGSEPVHPALVALTETVAKFKLPSRPFFDLIEANLQDQTVTEYESWDRLLGYCAFSAAPVGRMVLGVFGIRDAQAEALSDDVCVGLQLANFAQDVSVDRGKGRTYLVQADIRCGGMREAIRAMCDRAEALLASGTELELLVPLRLRIQLALYRLGGTAIVAAVRHSDYSTDVTRPHLSRSTKARLVPQAIKQSVGRREHVPAHHLA